MVTTDASAHHTRARPAIADITLSARWHGPWCTDPSVPCPTQAHSWRTSPVQQRLCWRQPCP